MKWEFNNDQPIYTQLVDQITRSIVSGDFTAGQKLASVRDLAQEARVNPNTMQKALSELERNGLVFSQRTSGRFITEDLEMLNSVKEKLAAEQIYLFLEKMSQLGFTKEDTIQLIKASTNN